MVVAFLSGPVPLLRENALYFLSAFAQNHPECRDVVLQHGALPPILSMISIGQQQQQKNQQHPQTASELVKIVRCMMILLGVTHPLTKLPPWSLISTTLPTIGSLLFSNVRLIHLISSFFTYYFTGF